METPQQQLTRILSDQGADGGLGFLMVDLYEIVGEASTVIQWLLHTTPLPAEVHQQLDATVQLHRKALEYISLLDDVRAYLTQNPAE